MPSKKKNNNQAGVRTGRPSNTGKRRSRRVAKGQGPGASTASSAVGPYARMLNDPCKAPLVPGMFGTHEGYLQRLHRVVSLDALAPSTATCGFVLWAPEYHNPGKISSDAPSREAIFNMWFGSGLTSSSLINLNGLSMTGEFGTQAIRDPASDFGRSALVASARTLSACMRLNFVGTISNCRGLVARLEVPYSMVDAYLGQGASVGNTVGITVDQLFAMSDDVRRTSLDPVEIKFVPRPDAKFLSGFGGPNDATGYPTWPDGARDTDQLLDSSSTNGTGTDVAFIPGESARVNDPMLIGFAWKGLGTNAADDFQLDLYKNLEWKPDASQGIPQVSKITMHTVPPVSAAARALDRAAPEWKTSMSHEVKSAATRISEMALSNAGKVITKTGKKVLSTVEGYAMDALAFAI